MYDLGVKQSLLNPFHLLAFQLFPQTQLLSHIQLDFNLIHS